MANSEVEQDVRASSSPHVGADGRARGTNGTPPRRSLTRADHGAWHEFWRQGVLASWSTGAMVLVILTLVGGMITLTLTKGLRHFWPASLVQVRAAGSTWLGCLMEREAGAAPGASSARVLLKVGNRDVYGADFKWLELEAGVAPQQPADAVAVERREHGDLYGYLQRVMNGDRTVATGAPAWDALATERRSCRDAERALRAVDDALEKATAPQTQLQAQLAQAAERAPQRVGALQAELAAEVARTRATTTALQAERDRHAAALAGRRAVFQLADGRERDVRLDDIVRAYRPNRLGALGKTRVYAARLAEFLFAAPRESNTEGGIFPALFGTVLMVLLMTLFVVPLGVVAALYLHEYARQGPLLRAVRLAVNNLAGVPSIVFGMFGLAFFVYGVGGFVDRTFFADALPNPTFGTGGLLWASLTLALLTLPVVIVATEEGLAAVPRANREASLALGATQWQTLWHIVLPNALPGILTGMILAVSRGSGEVAPLMLTGVVKLAPDLAVDGGFPFVHLERKFMHLGFHIYDVSMQSPNVEAAKPMVYATTLLLLLLVVALNAAAIVARNRMRRRYRGATL